VELLIYLVLGILWALPFKRIFQGIGQADPAAAQPDAENNPDQDLAQKKQTGPV